MVNLSVIICTYNPIQGVFEQCLGSVKNALEGVDSYEVLIVDNNSSAPLAELPWLDQYLDHNWRVITELQQGLTPARIRGIEESKGELLVFVDDDNFLRPDFFQMGLAIARDHSFIGAFSGQVNLVFESEPEAWTRPYWGMLVHRRFEKDIWSNQPHLDLSMPCGAGLYVRRSVALYYRDLHHQGKRKFKLDRSGASLFSAGDNDLAACACDIGLGVGLFHALWIDHYIPLRRTSKQYLLALSKGIAASTIIFKSFRGEFPQKKTFKNRLADKLRLLLKDGISREFFKSVLEGEKLGQKMLEGVE